MEQTGINDESKYPESVSIAVDRTGLAPKELRALRKVTGSAYDELDTETQLQAAAFIALSRLFPDDDPGVIWERADETRVMPPEAVPANPPDTLPSNDG